jgi:hypothetical protein
MDESFEHEQNVASSNCFTLRTTSLCPSKVRITLPSFHILRVRSAEAERSEPSARKRTSHTGNLWPRRTCVGCNSLILESALPPILVGCVMLVFVLQRQTFESQEAVAMQRSSPSTSIASIATTLSECPTILIRLEGPSKIVMCP